MIAASTFTELTVTGLGSDLILMGSAAWDCSNFRKFNPVKNVELVRCGLQVPWDFPKVLYERRLKQTFTDICEIYGNERVVWKLGNPGKKYFDDIILFNQLARKQAKMFSIKVLDAEAISNYYNSSLIDKVHPTSFVILRTIKSMFVYLQKMLTLTNNGKSNLAQYYLHMLNVILRNLHEGKVVNKKWEVGNLMAAFKTITKEGYLKLASQTEVWEQEDLGNISWSIK